jgi:hypothetical protein
MINYYQMTHNNSSTKFCDSVQGFTGSITLPVIPNKEKQSTHDDNLESEKIESVRYLNTTNKLVAALSVKRLIKTINQCFIDSYIEEKEFLENISIMKNPDKSFCAKKYFPINLSSH